MQLAEVAGLWVSYESREPHWILRDLTFSIARQERVALLGSSGCGKTTVCRAFMGLFPHTARMMGHLRFGCEGVEASAVQKPGWRAAVRISLIPQEAKENLHPMLTVGRTLAEFARIHRPERRDHAVSQALEEAGLNASAMRNAYPHELSGGQRQRALIAQAILCRPDLLLADEPTSALDPVAEHEIRKLVDRLVEQRQMSLLWVTHNPLLCHGMDRVLVMESGAIVEETTPGGLFERPVHPYTVNLMRSLPPALGESRPASG